MGTMSEEILGRKVGRAVRAGEIIVTPVDYVMAHDQTGPLAVESFRKLGRPLFDPDRAIMVFDHIIPAATVQSATLQRGL
ncbi:MAG: 3-isopropylmalate dehydratase large subunit, partial [Chloroflexia bacterium]